MDYNQFNKKDYMGICTSSIQRKTMRALPLIFNEQISRQKLNDIIQHEFQFDLSNVIMLSVSDRGLKVNFTVENILKAEFDRQNILVTEMQSAIVSERRGPKLYQISWNQSTKVHFTSTLKELHEQFLTVVISNNIKHVEVAKINLYLIVHGPYHHNIELPFDKDNIRILFDARISNIFEAKIQVKEFKLKTYQLPDLPQIHFSTKELIDQQIQAESNPSYNVPNILLNQETGYFQDQRPNINRPKKNNSFGKMEQSQMEMKLAWMGTETQLMPTLTVDISTQQIVRHSLQVLVWGSNINDETASYIFEAKFPLWKILQKKFNEKNMKIQSREGMSNIQIEERTIQLTQKLYSHHNVVGSCQILLHMKNEKMIEQAKYCTRTQDGIINLAPNDMSNVCSNPASKDIKSNNKTLHQLWKVINEIEEMINGNGQHMMLTIHQKLMDINQKIILSKNQIYTESNKVESLINSQNILIGIIDKLVPFIQTNENPTFSSLSWQVIFNIFEKNQFSLQNLSLNGIYNTTQAKHILVQKKDVSKKYLTILYSLIKYALKNYVLTNSMSDGYLKFLSLCFFRVKSFRNQFFNMIDINLEDQQIERRLAQYQAEIEPKTSFNDNFFKMKTNWNDLLFKEIESEPDIIKLENELKGNLKSKKWFMEIGFKDQLFYSFCCVFFDKLKELNLGGPQKWKHIDGYSQLSIIILSEMKRKEIKDYSHGLIKTSLSMLSNEYLINLLMPLTCEKTNLHDFQNVQIVLDIIYQYLNCLTKNKTTALSPSFNHNYFFSIIRTIIQGQHFYSINRILIIIYDYFNLFGEQSRYQISMFLLGNPFFRLYYHWSKDIRYTFYNILLIRIQYIKHRKANQILNKYHKALEFIGIIERLYEKRMSGVPTTQQNLLKKLRMKIYHKRKKMPQSTTLCSKNQFELEKLQRLWQQQSDSFEFKIRTAQDLQGSAEERVPISIPWIKSEDFVCTPEKKRRTYSQNIKIFEENEESSMKQSPAKEESSENLSNPILKRSVSSYGPNTESKGNDEKSRRKRKPSVFLNAITENTKQYTSTITNHLHYFNEITNEELKNVGRAKMQFKEVNEEIAKHIAKYSVCPERNFTEINRKQMQG